MSKELIRTVDLKKYFKTGGGTLHAVDGVDLVIREGRTLGVVGESGCGKSTLGRTILQIHRPTSGQVFYEGKDITKIGRRELAGYRRKMQIIFQDPYSSLNPRMSVQELIAEPLIINKILPRQEIYAEVERLMDLTGLAKRLAGAYPHELDGGRRQRIGIARALSLNPKFIVCDEPVSALDVSIQAQILNLLMDLQQEMGLAYLFITHDLSVVKHISDEIVVMYLGMCIEQTSASELFREPLHPYTRALLDSSPLPDPAMRRKKIRAIKGEISNPIDPKPGCRFAPRCPMATERCFSRTPELREIREGHFVACHEV